MINERAVFFPCGHTSLAGVVSEPTQPNGQSVLIPWGAGAFPSSGPNRIRARMARNLAERGFYSFRFDYRGVGESEGDYRLPTLRSPYTEEIVAAGDWLDAQGYGPMVVIANCFGAWSSLLAAPMLKNLDGLVMVNSPVGRDHHEARAVQGSWRWWADRIKHLNLTKLRSHYRREAYRKMVIAKASSMVRGSKEYGFSEGIRGVMDRGIPILLLYGQDDFRADLQIELTRGLAKDLARAPTPTRVVIVEERLEGYASFPAQESLLAQVSSWLDDLSESREDKS